MSRLLVTAKTGLSIGPVMNSNGSDFTAADFPANAGDWTPIGGLTNLGSAGDVAELITSQQIGIGRTRKAKGTRNAGAMELLADLDTTDAGQIALIAAERSSEAFAFKVEFNDAPQGGTPSTRYFVAIVMSQREQYDEANSTVKLAATLEIDSNIVRVAAAPAPAGG